MTEQTLKFFHVLPYRNVLVKNLSGGNRRKLSVAVTCIGSSTNVLMDEPTSGTYFIHLFICLLTWLNRNASRNFRYGSSNTFNRICINQSFVA